jgi:hypothetical protein
MYTDKERRIYGPYHDGREPVYADPLAVWRKLTVATRGELAALLARYNENGTSQDLAAGPLAEAAVAAFGLVPFDKLTGHGACEDDALWLLGDFLAWRAEKKNGAVTSPTSPAYTGYALPSIMKASAPSTGTLAG